MSFSYQENQLNWGSTEYNYDLSKFLSSVDDELIEKYSYRGPYYLYNAELLKERLSLLERSLPTSTFYYSVKSLSNINILKIIAQFSSFGVDVVSVGELIRSLESGFSPKEIVFAGVGKVDHEIIRALQVGIKSFHVESLQEIYAIERLASELKLEARIAFRINPGITVDTHEYITTGKDESKFGISASELPKAFEIVSSYKYIKLVGLQTHLGSQLLSIEPYAKSISFLAKIVEKYTENMKDVSYLSLGGGFGIDYDAMLNCPSAEFNLAELNEAIKVLQNYDLKIDFEPGRFISAYVGALITNVTYLKEKPNFKIAICDAGMSELIRPALYRSKHPLLPIVLHSAEKQKYDIVGPICESADFFAKQIDLPELRVGDQLVIGNAGAYGSVMSSNYNTRPLVPEVLLHDGKFSIIRKPQTYQDLLDLEKV